MLEIARRTSTFEEVVKGLDESNALYEARRCLSCGNCFECDNCYGVCPDNAVIKLGPGKGFEFNLRLLQGLRPVRQRMSLRRHRHVARGTLRRCEQRSPSAEAPSRLLQGCRLKIRQQA